MKRVALALCLALAEGLACAAEPLRPFDAGSLRAIRTQSAGKSFIVSFWSVTCEPCRDDMRVLKALQRKYPSVVIHLVAADPPGEEAAIAAFLRRYDPGPVTRWAFADDFAERVRYAVDPAWRGELPRTYLYDHGQVARVITGTLERQALEDWLGASRRKLPE